MSYDRPAYQRRRDRIRQELEAVRAERAPLKPSAKPPPETVLVPVLDLPWYDDGRGARLRAARRAHDAERLAVYLATRTTHLARRWEPALRHALDAGFEVEWLREHAARLGPNGLHAAAAGAHIYRVDGR